MISGQVLRSMGGAIERLVQPSQQPAEVAVLASYPYNSSLQRRMDVT